jgi:hypothetical protein
MMRTFARLPAARSTVGSIFGRSRAASPLPATAPVAAAGHDFARIAVSAPGEGPIQRMRWTWDESNRNWSGPPCAGSVRQPPLAGRRDGEEYEDNR